MNDAQLITQFLKGNIQAFNILVARWEKQIFNFIYRNVSNEDIAKDVCQKTFIRVYMKLNKLKNPQKFSPWIYRIALNMCRDEFKKNKKRYVYLDNPNYNDNSQNFSLQLKDDKINSPDSIYHNNQISSILKKSLQKIPEQQRIIIIMKHYQGLKFKEIAEILKEPINTVKSRLYYGLRSLRKILEQSQLTKEVFFNEM